MITLSLGGTEIVVKPKKLLDYVEKLDFIKMRRTRPWDLIQGFPKEITEENYKILVSLAMSTCYSQSSSVSIEEELQFDKSEEGFYYDVWRCLPRVPKETWQAGLNRARQLWEGSTKEEKNALHMAMLGVDERANLKNSDGPSESDLNSSPGNPDSPAASS